MITFSRLCEVIGGEVLQFVSDRDIRFIVTDSRRSFGGEHTIFIAKHGPTHDGHQFIHELYNAGIRNFIVEINVDYEAYPEGNFNKVRYGIEALQKLAIFHRNRFHPEVIGITGSNGKTIVKEWLLQLLSVNYRIAATPHSYNSQLGVPLSVWQLTENHDLAIFEAGISKPAEMENLEKIIKPTIGIFTNIGSAHDQGFLNREEKIREKLKLFSNSEILIYCKDHKAIEEFVPINLKTFTWGNSKDSDIQIISRKKRDHRLFLELAYQNNEQMVEIASPDDATTENLMHCISCMLYLKFSWTEIKDRIRMIIPVPMRLELKKGQNGCYIIDDSYTNDIAGLTIALNFLRQQKQRVTKTVILSDIHQAGANEEDLYASVNDLMIQNKISRLIGVGPQITAHQDSFRLPSIFFNDTKGFLRDDSLHFTDEMILVKGARAFTFERIVNRLQEKIHGTRLEINLGALTHNLNFFRSKIQRRTKVMVMVKAFAYGAGMYEVANLLQYHKVDYLGVAYTDEGVDLRNNGIETPIMIMNPSPEGYDQLLKYNLEPEVYSFQQLKSLLDFLKGKQMKIHLKLDTGMHRLGFEAQDLDKLVQVFTANPQIHIQSIFSHLAAADEVEHEQFSREQAENFIKFYVNISNTLKTKPLRHLLNSPGIISYPEYQYDMVRLGIGLYGIEPRGLFQRQLQPISTLKTIISQIKTVEAGKTIGYGRKGKITECKKIATIAIGYADGFSRFFSNGKGKVNINGKLAPVIGNVCMDMTMVDITGHEVAEGDDVIIFGENPTIDELAKSIGTIPYEILTSVSERVKRIYLYD